MEKFAKPWQAMPTRIISLALVHAEQKTDFDHQLAFLLLDVGVETALKTYLINKKLDVEKIIFPELLKRIEDELNKDNLQVPLDEIDHFHKIRNKLYHQGDGVKPTEENLKKYADLAKTLLMTLLDVDIDQSKEQGLIQTDHSLFSLAGIRKNMISLQSNSSLMVEHLYPQIATRKIEAELRYIRTDTGPDDESYPPLVKAEFRQQRIDAFNKITRWEFTYDEEDIDHYKFVEYIIDNPEHLHVWFALQEIGSDDWREDWKQYQKIVDFLEYEQAKDSKTEDKGYEEINEWTHGKAAIVCQWVTANIPDVEPKGPDFYFKLPL